MPTFNDSENKPPRTIIPEQDCVFRVVAWETSISKGKKTGGCEALDLELDFFGKDGKPLCAGAFEHLIDHPSCSWKIDCFLKSAGQQLRKGENFNWGPAPVGGHGRYIDPLGLRGWCKVAVDTYTPSNAAMGANGQALPGQSRQKNVVVTFYTDRTKIAPDEALRQAAAPEPSPF